MPVLNGYLTVQEAASVVGVHAETVKRFCREGRLHAEKVNNAWLIHQDVIRRFAETYSEPRGRPPREIGASSLERVRYR